jgi:hypothetical protein
MLSTTLNSQDTTVESSLAGLYSVISELNSLLFGNTCPTNYDITSQIPLWVVYEKQQRINDGLSGLSIYDFIQKYYDWLYCDGDTGAQYELGKRLLDNVDIEKTRSVFLQRLASIYANGFDNSALAVNGGLIQEENLRKFLTGIKRAFYHKKTTEDGIKYFFETLFGVNQEDIQIQIPKQYILRLNGGKFFDDNYKFVNMGATSYDAGNFLASYLNGSRLQDGNWIQDWSYLLKVGVPAYYYKDVYLNIAHPAGIKVVFEKTLADYQGPTFDDTIPTVCDSAFLRNYAAYGISFDYAGYTSGLEYAYSSYWDNVEGLTFIGLPRNTGCCGASFAGFTGTTNLFPNWTEQRTTTNFKDIYINTMFDLCFSQLEVAGSPNSGYSTSCS